LHDGGRKILARRSDFRQSGEEGATVNLQVEYWINFAGGTIVSSLTDLRLKVREEVRRLQDWYTRSIDPGMPQKAETASFPFTSDQVESFNAFQKSWVFHPFTCGNREHGGDDILVARENGLYCPTCDYRQDWMHRWMGDGTWKRLRT
jgi:hypothetical protein